MKRKWKQLPPGELEGTYAWSIPRLPCTWAIPTPIVDEERHQLRQDLMEYCERDTGTTVELVERLRKLAAE